MADRIIKLAAMEATVQDTAPALMEATTAEDGVPATDTNCTKN